ncbi:D-alanine--D-alanine ligase family protein [Xylocopilactobacillus apicola]|uniref:D-alanine--D-alanine ligase n=1 Tax=Xylocopilactobacillus apicola TaxID=2932184 RepID=A0AAU9DDS2_9LACO|nr:D-alanine--D-alanine ligase [Xylocopilactobacillus apicola]BDR58982.1 D-alanine--D-alanine ligase [Xylocopilactobacillus apicola]
MKIAVLAGGISTERNVSLVSGKRISNALRQKGHEVAFVDSFLGIEKLPNDLSTLFSSEVVDYDIDIDTSVLTEEMIRKLRKDDDGTYFGPNVIKVLSSAEIVFIALHGGAGENGKVQALLDLYNIKYTGSDYFGAAIAMNKAKSKEIMKYYGLPTADFVSIKRGDPIPTEFPFDYPVVVKPVNGGSSVGTVIAKSYAEARQAIEKDFVFDDDIIVEEFIKGREFSQGVIGTHALPAVEITVNDGWYDFEHKFKTGNTTVFTAPPKNFSADLQRQMDELSIKAGRDLNLSNYYRLDYLLNENGFYIIEANVLPGLTPLSLMPQEAEAQGISYPDLIEMILDEKVRIYQQ